MRRNAASCHASYSFGCLLIPDPSALCTPPPLPAGRLEFAGYLPPNCQAALVQPVGSHGVLVVGGDTQRGFTRLDQAWAAAVAEKLDVQLERLAPGSGFKQQ